MAELKYSKEIDYSQKVNSSPIYGFQKVTQSQGGANTLTLQQSSSVMTYFDLPPDVIFNPSKSFFRWQIEFPATVADDYGAAMLDIPPIRSVTLQTRSGMYLCQITNFQYYWKMASNLITKTQDFNSYSPGGYDASATDAITECLVI